MPRGQFDRSQRRARTRAQLLEAAARVYARLPGLLRDTLAANVWVGAQSVADAERFAALGVDPARLSVVGNLKFERTMPAEIGARGARARARYAPDRPVWTAGSTHAGEEAILLAAHRLLRAAQPRALLVLAPRHPERFDALAAAIAAQGFRCQRRSRDLPQDGADPDSEVLLLDTLGELPEFYAAADVAFVGGSLVPAGGHNLLEPAALALPVLAGPALFSAPDVAQALRDAGALTIVQDAGGLAAALRALLDSPAERARSGAAGRAVIEANRGALERLLRLIDPLLAMPL